MYKPQILIVSVENQLCKFLEQLCCSWKMVVKNITQPCLLIDSIHKTFYNLILLDIRIPTIFGLDLLVKLREMSPESKVIIITGNADHERSISALKLGAFDFLEKPIASDVLFHTINRALETQKMELEYKKTLKELQRSQEDALTSKAQLEQLNAELADTTKALVTLARHISFIDQHLSHEEFKYVDRKVDLAIRPSIMSIIEGLKKDKNFQKYESQIMSLIFSIENIISGSNTAYPVISPLSTQELRIVSMIKNGMTSEEIASNLHISLSTVKTHRKNIRKKLNINGTKDRLGTYLHTMNMQGITEVEQPQRNNSKNFVGELLQRLRSDMTDVEHDS